MTPVVHLEIANTSEFLHYDPQGDFISLRTPEPLAFTSGVYEIALPVQIKIPPGYSLMVENFKKNLLQGVTVKQCVTENLYWYSSVIIDVNTKFVVPKLHPLCILRLHKNTSFETLVTNI